MKDSHVGPSPPSSRSCAGWTRRSGAFFSRVKRGDKAGFPRFRASSRYHAAEFRVGDGLTLRKSGRIGFVGIPGEVKVKWHRELPSLPKSAILTRHNRTEERRVGKECVSKGRLRGRPAY